MPNAQKSLRSPAWLYEKGQWGIRDDFFHFTTTEDWTSVLTDSGSVAVSDAAGGIAVISPSDGSVVDNDQSYFRSTAELFKVAAGCHLYFECRAKVTESATNVANAFFGFANAIAAELLVDDGAGVRTTGDIFAIYKVDGSLTWRCISSVNSTQTITVANTSETSATYYTFRIEVRDVDGTNVESTFFVDDQPLRDTNNKAIKHTTALASSTEMHVGVGCKNGAGTHDTVSVDWIFAAQTPRPA